MRPVRAEKASSNMTLRLSDEEKARLRLAAHTNKQDPTGFARDAILNAADLVLGDDDGDDAGSVSQSE